MQLRLARLEFHCLATITAGGGRKVSTKRPPVHHRDGPERRGSACPTSRCLSDKQVTTFTSQRYAENSDSITNSLRSAERQTQSGCHDFTQPSAQSYKYAAGHFENRRRRSVPSLVRIALVGRQGPMTSAKIGSSSRSVVN